MGRWFREGVRFWPVLLAAPSLMVQTDLMIVYTAWWADGLSSLTTFLIVAAVATAKMRWSYWLWGWFSRLVTDTERFQRFADIAKEAGSLVWAEGFVDRALAELKLRHAQAHSNSSKLKHTLRTARWGGDIFLLGVGSYPVFGVRGPLVLIIGIAQWERELRALMIGNMIRVAYLMGALKAVFWFF